MRLFRKCTTENKVLLKYIFWKNNKNFSVPLKLNIVNFLVIISGFLGIYGAYEIQLGGKMHELNYFHQKYVTEVIQAVKEFEHNTSSIIIVEEHIQDIRRQPQQCIELIGPVELFMMQLINTDSAVQICTDDVLVADNILQKIQAFKNKEIDASTLLKDMHNSLYQFDNNGAKFEPLIGKTVNVTFFIVITILIICAFIVPLFGLLLSRSVANDYQVLLTTKFNLQEEKKRSAKIQAERMASLTTMVAGIAHEVNTPIGASISAASYSVGLLNKVQEAYDAEVLTEEDLHEFFKESMKVNDIVSNNLSRTSELIQSFKQVSVDQTVDDIQIINVKSYIKKILLILTPLTKGVDIDITFSCNDKLQANIHGGTLSQIITNLVTNAVNHAFEKSAQGTLSITAIETENQEVCLSVKDNGCGINEIELLHIFEPFFTTKRGSGGTGLGLYIVHNLIVDKLQGRIVCSSTVNEGTEFTIYFPIGVIL